MFKTPTQKSFKKKMKEFEKEKKLKGYEDIYNFNRRTVKFDRPVNIGGGSFSRILTITITLLILISSYLLSKNGLDFNSELLNQSVKVAAGNEKVLSLKDSYSLKELEKIIVSVNKYIQMVSDFNHHNEISDSYKKEVSKGISDRKKYKEQLNKMDKVEIFNSLYKIADEYLADVELGFQYYSSFIIHGNNNDLHKAIEYFNNAIEHNAAYNQEFINIMDEHGYKYEKLEDGTIRYWYNASLLYITDSMNQNKDPLSSLYYTFL